MSKASFCWRVTWLRGKGIYPYRRSIHQQTYWCSDAEMVRITARRTAQWVATAPLCKGSSDSWLEAGGVGAWSMTMRSRGGFECGPFPGIGFSLNDQLDLRVKYYANGRNEAV